MNNNPIHWRPLREVVGRLQKTHCDTQTVANMLALEIARNADLRMHMVQILLPDLLWVTGKIGDGGQREGGSDAQWVLAPSPISPSKVPDGSGHDLAARNGPAGVALPSGSNRDGGGPHREVGNDQRQLAPPSRPQPESADAYDRGVERLAIRLDKNRDGGGHDVTVANDPTRRAPPSRPLPKAIDPNLRNAIIKEGVKTANIIFKLHDGTDIMKVLMRELPHYRALGAKQAAICDRILKHAGNAQPDQKVGDVVTATTLEKYVKDAGRAIDALV